MSDDDFRDELRRAVERLELELAASRRATEAFAVWLEPEPRAKLVAGAIANADELTRRAIADALNIADERLAAAADEIARERRRE